MKKLLLSIACLFGMASFANAEDVTLSVANLNVDDINGEYVAEVPTTTNDEGKTVNGTGQHWQPVESLTLEGYTFSFVRGTYTDKNGNEKDATNPAVYSKLGTPDTPNEIRIYNGNSMTVAAPEGVTFTKVVSGSTTLYEGTAASTFTYTASATVKMSTIVITLAGEGSGEGSGDGNEGEEPANPSVATVIFSETFATSLGEFTTENTVLPDELSYVWAYNSYGYAKASGYYKQAYAAESWLISPVIDLTGCTNCSLAFSSAINYATDFATAYIRVEGGEWVALEGVNYGTGTSWDFVDNNISIAAYDGKKIQLGFKYTSTTEAAGTWELKNLSVSGTKDDSSEPTEPTEPSEPVTSNVVFSETFATSLGDFTIEDTNLPEGLSYVWAYNSYGYAKASGYYKQAYEAESWLISPVIDLTGRTGCALAFSSALNYASNCVGAFAREEGGQWVGLEDVDYGTGSSWTFSDNEGIDLSAFDGKKIQLGFQYTSTADAAATWEIKNLVVTGNVADGIFDVEVENAPVEYFNIQGVRVENPENGLFIRRQGNKVSKVVIR